MVIRSRTSRTVTASACLADAARAARQAIARGSVTEPRTLLLAPPSTCLEVLSHHDGDVPDVRRHGPNVHPSHPQQRANLLRGGQEAAVAGHDLRPAHA